MGTEGNWDDNAQANSLIGVGPYKVVSFDPGVEVVLERNEEYFDGPKGKPTIKNMIVRSIPDMGTQQAELMSGGIHWMYNVKKDVGEFKNNDLNGFATRYDKDGNVLKEGIWKNDKFLYSRKGIKPNLKMNQFKSFCKEIGFTVGTEKFGDCVLKMMDRD